ncbi:hypothetical protein CHARACLAT_019447 [Characodon lateralis]|uniref:Uncharacterized protein n=1 Tax=Characodon lateralis TaxID=208331 RepID=A0ABU7F499_9TELE|nr:hypothetical protein [Characodon lateralis]
MVQFTLRPPSAPPLSPFVSFSILFFVALSVGASAVTPSPIISLCSLHSDPPGALPIHPDPPVPVLNSDSQDLGSEAALSGKQWRACDLTFVLLAAVSFPARLDHVPRWF